MEAGAASHWTSEGIVRLFQDQTLCGEKEQIIELPVGLVHQRRVCAALPTTAGGKSGDDLHIQEILV